MARKVIAEVVVMPVGTGTTALSEYVAAALEELAKEKRLQFKLTPMGTVILGELDLIIEVVKRMHEAPFKRGLKRVYTILKIDDRRDRRVTLDSKVKDVLRHGGNLAGSGSDL
jgi:uncharacterized protein (TIGR00106 family)